MTIEPFPAGVVLSLDTAQLKTPRRFSRAIHTHYGPARLDVATCPAKEYWVLKAGTAGG
jgi:hypothetical protein